VLRSTAAAHRLDLDLDHGARELLERDELHRDLPPALRVARQPHVAEPALPDPLLKRVDRLELAAGERRLGDAAAAAAAAERRSLVLARAQLQLPRPVARGSSGGGGETGRSQPAASRRGGARRGGGEACAAGERAARTAGERRSQRRRRAKRRAEGRGTQAPAELQHP